MELDDFDKIIIDELRGKWHEIIKGKGGHCPCCDRWGKVNAFKLTQALALTLKWMQLHPDGSGWIDMQNKAPRWILRAKCYPVLAYWKLIEFENHCSGIWGITQKGLDFLNGVITIPQKAFVYNNQVFDVSEKQVSFRDCFGKKFDYDEMLSDRYDWNKVKTNDKKGVV